MDLTGDAKGVHSFRYLSHVYPALRTLLESSLHTPEKLLGECGPSSHTPRQHLDAHFKRSHHLARMCLSTSERRGRNIHVRAKQLLAASCMHPSRGSNPQPRHTAWQKSNLQLLGVEDDTPTKWATLPGLGALLKVCFLNGGLGA